MSGRAGHADTTDQRLTALEARLHAAEDRLAIYDLLNSYGPLVDSGTADPAAALWREGGGYSFTLPSGGTRRLEAPGEIAAMYGGDGHRGLVETGCAHFTATPKVAVAGDNATAVGYSFVVLREGEHWIVWRAAINHWTLERGEVGWRIVERVNHTLDGSEASHALMRQVLDT